MGSSNFGHFRRGASGSQIAAPQYLLRVLKSSIGDRGIGGFTKIISSNPALASRKEIFEKALETALVFDNEFPVAVTLLQLPFRSRGLRNLLALSESFRWQ